MTRGVTLRPSVRCPQLEIQEIDPRRKHLRKLTGRNRGTVSELNDNCSSAQSPQHKKKLLLKRKAVGSRPRRSSVRSTLLELLHIMGSLVPSPPYKALGFFSK